MNILLFVGSLVAVIIGAVIFVDSQSAIHEIEAFLLFLIASVLFSSAAIIGADYKQIRKRVGAGGKPKTKYD